MNTVTLKGNKIKIADGFPLVGDAARPFTLVTSDLKEVSLADYAGKKIVLNIFPSIDTGVCALQLETFSKKIDKMEEVVLMTASKDLPFALKRFCGDKNIENAVTGSDFRYNNLSKGYGVEILEGPLQGLYARAVIIIDKYGHVAYTELVAEIAQEPNYEAALAALK
mgnify:CR=1 FL=1